MGFAWVETTDPSLRRRATNELFQWFHENSKFARDRPPQPAPAELDSFVMSRAFKQFRGAQTLDLPDALPLDTELGTALIERRSLRELDRTLSLEELSTVLHSALGPTSVLADPGGVRQARRSWPSAGGLYPLDCYVVVQRVDGCPNGLYHYNLVQHRLEEIDSRDPVAVLDDAYFGQDWATGASVAVVLVGVFERSTVKYGERGYRFTLLDAGHALQNVLLVAQALGLPAVGMGGFCDDALAADLHLDGLQEAVVHTALLGGGDG